MTVSRHTRRQFLSSTSIAALTMGAASSLPLGTSRLLAGSANERIRVGVMGTSRNSVGGDGRGTTLATEFAKQPNTEVAYVCDVDSRNVGKAIESVSQFQDQPIKGVTDFRRILDDQSIDVLVIATPDHWHGPAAIFGAQAGKHIYVEKPCCHNPAEGEMMLAAATAHRTQMQVGTQRRSHPALRDAISRLHAGEFGKVLSAECYYFNAREAIGKGQSVAVPKWLDWKLWQGPAPSTDYRDNIVHYNWHWFWKWGTGELGNNGVHTIDLCRWGLGVDYPQKVISLGQQILKDDQETPDRHTARYEFDNGTSITWEGHSRERRSKEHPQFECRFKTEKGSLETRGGTWKFNDFDGKVIDKGSGSGGNAEHVGNLLDAVRGDAELFCPITEGYKSTLLCHLGNIAHRAGLGEGMLVDSETGKLKTDNEQAHSLWAREYTQEFRPSV